MRAGAAVRDRPARALPPSEEAPRGGNSGCEASGPMGLLLRAPRDARGVESVAGVAQPSLSQRAGAEALGAFALVFAGCGAIITNAQHPGSLGGVGISLVFGLVILAGIAPFGHISGA